MSLLAAILYGSHARGDSGPESDVDILGISESGMISRTEHPPVIISVYPQKYIMQRARSGDLFTWHIATEGIPLYDAEGLFQRLKAEFRLKTSYAKERKAAAEVGWSLLCSDIPTNSSSAVKAMMYSIRTIAISKLAERKTPAFSHKEILRGFPDNDLDALWKEKYATSVSVTAKMHLKSFLTRNTTYRPPWAMNSIHQLLADKHLSRVAFRKTVDILTGSGQELEYLDGEWRTSSSSS